MLPPHLPSKPEASRPLVTSTATVSGLPDKPVAGTASESLAYMPIRFPMASPSLLSHVQKTSIFDSKILDGSGDIMDRQYSPLPGAMGMKPHASLPDRPVPFPAVREPCLPTLELPKMLRSLLSSASKSPGILSDADESDTINVSGKDQPAEPTAVPRKRKKSESPLTDSDNQPTSRTPIPVRQMESAWTRASKRIAVSSPAAPEPNNEIPLILPSRRSKNHPSHRATLFPVNQIPVFALPPLPIIDDDAILKQVFTHLSLFQKVKGKFEDPETDLAKHYEKLEHVGDSILGMIVTTWLHEMKPGLTPGTATKLKAHLVSNATLSHLSGLYNMPQRLIADGHLLPVLRASTDVRAALMEAYIAGIYFSYPADQRISVAMPILEGWLREMYDPLFDFFYTYMRNEHDQHQNAIGADQEGVIIVVDEDEVDRVNTAAMGMAPLVKMYAETYERELTWEEDKAETTIGPLFKVKCIVDGMELGEAMRASKKDAKNVAAWEAAKKLGLTNRSL